jgi:hypothetical protein
MEPLLTTNVQAALSHALPFRLLFEEHRRRREPDLLANATTVFAAMTQPPAGADTAAQILQAVETQEACYAALEEATAAIAAGTSMHPLDTLVANCQAADAPLKSILHKMEASAVCLSGGGIRSATISLGVLQGLARFSRPGGKTTPGSLMSKLDYLSTVSGGGYMGSWLMSWIYRQMKSSGSPSSYNDVLEGLAGDAPVTAGDPEPQPVRHLRSYTSFLAPELGLTLDAFTLAAIILRNILVNWVMLIPVLLALIAALVCVGFAVAGAHNAMINASKTFGTGLAVMGGVLVVVPFLLAAWAAGKALPSHSAGEKQERPSGTGWVRTFQIAVTAGCWLLSILSGYVKFGKLHGVFLFAVLTAIALPGFGLLGWTICSSYNKREHDKGESWYLANAFRATAKAAPPAKATAKAASVTRRRPFAAVMAVVATLSISALTGGLLTWLESSVASYLDGPGIAAWMKPPGLPLTDQPLFVLFALPMVTAIVTTTTLLFCALLGVFEVEDDREWWVRNGGWLLGFNLAWMAALGVALYGSTLAHALWVGLSGVVVGTAGSYLGYSGATVAAARPVKTSQLGSAGSFLMKHSLVLPVVGGVAILLILLGMVGLEEGLRKSISGVLFEHASRLSRNHLGMYSAGILLAVAGTLAFLINWAININLFSLHGMYRMRLMRAFLGASNVFRHPDPFTKFDWRDTPLEADMPCCAGVPMHLLNATLNLTGTKNPAWRQRKAEGFSFSPVACGGWRVGYVPTPTYGGTKGLSLATAMAISGAAANPNMGYQSSPVLSLLMTFFNLRLGCWLPNPARPTPHGLRVGKTGKEYFRMGESGDAFFSKSGPSFALWPLFAEALGLTDDTYRWVELTDGGHFEDLAIYEMVLRRVKNIVIVDAGCDPKFGFEDLGNAIRKIQIDLGVPIVFSKDLKMSQGPKVSNSYCVVAKIQYQCADINMPGCTGEQVDGRLVYIKAGLTGEEPADILQYARTHESFPHETTADQFFNESQFESYRHLGSWVVDCITSGNLPTDQPPLVAAPTMERFCDLAQTYWNDRPKPSA